MLRIGSVLLFTAGLCSADVEDRLTKSYKAPPGGKLVLEAEFGSMDVAPGSGSSVELELLRTVDADEREARRILDDLDLQATETAGEVRIQAVFKEGWRPRSRSSRRSGGRGRQLCRDNECLEYADRLRRFEYRIRVPKQFHVELSTRSGSVSVGDLDGSARARTSGGNLRFGRISGPVWGRTSGGNVTLEGSSGVADVSTSGGDVRIGDVAGEVSARTSGGNIRIERAGAPVTASTSGGNVEVHEVKGSITASTSGGSVTAYLRDQPQAPCRLSTSGGSINIYLADAVKLDLDARTSGGGVSVDFPVTVSGTLRRSELKASINGGGPLLHLRTSGGGIHVRKSDARAARSTI